MMRNLITRMRMPIEIPRWVLTLKYILFVFIGVTVFVTSSPSLDITTWDGYTPFWSIAVIVSSFASMVGSLSPTFEVLERWSVVTLSSLLIGYAAAPLKLVLEGDTDRAAYSVLALTLAVLPTARAAMLIHRTGRVHHGKP